MMKKIFIAFSGLACLIGAAHAQNKSVVKPATTLAKSPLKNGNDSLSYALGVNIATSLQQQGIDGLNLNVLKMAMEDKLKKGKTIMDEQNCNMTLQQKLQEATQKKVKVEKDKGAAFLAQNAKMPGVKVLPSGLQYKVINEGEANGLKPTLADTVVVHYTGTLIDGQEFDSSVKRGQPAEFTPTGVIRGWTEILQLMPKGAKWKVFIPSDLGYGDRGAGAMIKPGSTLIFDIELLNIKPAAIK